MQFLDSFDSLAFLRRIDYKLAIKTGLTAILSFVTASFYTKLFDRPDTLLSGLWCVLTAIVVIQAHIGSTYKAAWNRFLGVFIGSFMGGLFAHYLGAEALALGAAVALTVLLCSAVGIMEAYRIAALSTAIIMLLWSNHQDINPWTFSLFRFIDSCVGILIAVAVSHSLWPAQTWRSLERTFAKTIEAIGKYYRLATDLEGNHDTTTLYNEVFEMLIGMRKSLDESKLEFFSKSQRAGWIVILSELEKILEAIATLDVLRKDNFSVIFDDPLAQHIQQLVDETEIALDQIEQSIEKGSYHVDGTKLAEAENALRIELERFRQTRATRKFDLKGLESFYAFFYHLRFVAEEILLILRTLPNTPDTSED